MRYYLKERAWTLRESFTIRDEAGNVVLEVKGKFFHIGDDLTMHDHHSKQEVARIKQRVISLVPSYDIYRNGQHWAHVHEKLIHLFGERFKIDGEQGLTFHIDGNILNWDYRVTDNQGNLMAQISRRLSLIRDSYLIDTAQGIDVPFIVALAIVIEMVKEHHENQ